MRSQSGRPALTRPGFSPRIETLEDRITPVIVTVPDVFTAPQGEITTIPAAEGLLKNDFSTVDFGATLTATQVGAVTATGTTRALPPDTVQVNPDGSVVINPPDLRFPDTITELQFSYSVTNLNDPTEFGGLNGTATITVTEPRDELIAVGAGQGGAPVVKLYRAGTGDLVRSFLAYESTFTGGVRVATGDLNRDGIDDIVTIPGPGGSARLKVFDGESLVVLFDDFFLDPNFRGGGYVAVGDQQGDGSQEIILGAGEGGGPIVSVIDPGLDPVLGSFFTSVDSVLRVRLQPPGRRPGGLG